MPIEEEGYPSTELPSFKNAPNYYAAILKYFAPYLGGQVVEVGAGIGTFSQCLLSFPKITTLTLVEPAKNLFPILRKKLSGNSKVRLVNGNLQSVADLPGQIRSRVNVRLDCNQGGQGHAQETVYARGDYSTSADG